MTTTNKAKREDQKMNSKFLKEWIDCSYDDWMTTSNNDIKKLYIAKDIVDLVLLKYDEIQEETNEQLQYLFRKIEAANQKIGMTLFAENEFHKCKADFESRQNMDVPACYGLGKTKILFYLESMVVYARNTLDVLSPIFSDLCFNKRVDSFNKFTKLIKNNTDSKFEKLKKYFNDASGCELSVYRLLCGEENGRALRDIIIHQTNINIEYDEYKENSEKEILFIYFKDMPPIPIDMFVTLFCIGFIDILANTIDLIKEIL